MMRYLVLLAGLGVSFFSQAHEVHASNIDVTVVKNQVEVLQTTSVHDSQLIAKQLGAKGDSHQSTLAAMSTGWQIQSENGLCNLKKQAYRLTHHESQLQMRYLFNCEQNAATSLALPWFNLAPNDHFIIMKLTMNNQSETVIFQKQDLVIDLTI